MIKKSIHEYGTLYSQGAFTGYLFYLLYLEWLPDNMCLVGDHEV